MAFAPTIAFDAADTSVCGNVLPRVPDGNLAIRKDEDTLDAFAARLAGRVERG